MTLIRDFDEATITALIAQDDQAFKQLVKAFHPMLKKLAASIVGESIAEDVAQDAWISIYQNLPEFERRSSLKTWVYRITSNKAISRQRREGKVVAFSELGGTHDEDKFDETGRWRNPPSQWEETTPDRLLTGQELQDCINHVLSGLPQLQQAIFMLNDVEGEKSSEICNILEVSASNMRVLLHRARTKLFEHIDHFQETGEC